MFTACPRRMRAWRLVASAWSLAAYRHARGGRTRREVMTVRECARCDAHCPRGNDAQYGCSLSRL